MISPPKRSREREGQRALTGRGRPRDDQASATAVYRPKRRSSSARVMRRATGRPCGQLELTLDFDPSRRVGARISVSPSRCPTRTTEWQAIVASSASVVVLRARASDRSPRDPPRPHATGERSTAPGTAPARRERARCDRRTARSPNHRRRARRRRRRAAPLRRPRPRPAAPSASPASRLALATSRRAQSLEGDALVSGMLIDQPELPVALAHEIAVEDLSDDAQRRKNPVLAATNGSVRRHRGGRGTSRSARGAAARGGRARSTPPHTPDEPPRLARRRLRAARVVESRRAPPARSPRARHCPSRNRTSSFVG